MVKDTCFQRTVMCSAGAHIEYSPRKIPQVERYGIEEQPNRPMSKEILDSIVGEKAKM